MRDPKSDVRGESFVREKGLFFLHQVLGWLRIKWQWD